MTFNASSGPPYHLNITLNFHITCICFHAGFVSLTEYISRSKGASEYNNHQLPSTASHRNTPNTYHSEASTSTAQTEITVLNGDDDSPHRLEAEKPQHSIMQVVPYIEVYVFGVFSFALFIVQAITHVVCENTLISALDDPEYEGGYNASVRQELRAAKQQYDVLIPYNVLTIMFIFLQVSGIQAKRCHFTIT